MCIIFLSSCWEKEVNYQDLSNDELINLAMQTDTTEQDIAAILNTMDICEVDDDCEAFYWVCPLWCHIAVNKNNSTAAQAIMNSWKNTNGDTCVYDCVWIQWAKCQNSKCVAIAEELPNNQIDDNIDSSTTEWQDYEEINMIVKWVWPIISGEAWIWEEVLALNKTFEAHSDHIFIEKALWESFLTEWDITLPWTKVKFKWKIVGIDAGAWNHYYNATVVDQLTKTADATRSEIDTLLQNYAFCEVDADCDSFYWECPFGCHQYMNKKYSDIAKQVMKNFINNNPPICTYKCIELPIVKCENYQCKAVE